MDFFLYFPRGQHDIYHHSLLYCVWICLCHHGFCLRLQVHSPFDLLLGVNKISALRLNSLAGRREGGGEHKLTEAGWGCETDADLEASTKPFI